MSAITKHETGAVLFTTNMQSLSDFYERVAEMTLLLTAEDHIRLEKGLFRLTVHQIPEPYAKNITITTPLFLADQTSLVSASSEFGLNGTVTIQNPTSNLSESLGPLPSSMLDQQALQAQRCAASHGGASSSFIIAGRDTVPTEPGGWLASSLGFQGLGHSLLADTMIDEQPPTALVMTEASESISLRRLTPIGFLTQRFAGNGSDGCRS